MNTTPIHTDIVLLGGGHSHVLLIRRWAMHPLPGVRVTLISQSTSTPYSGMLPGYIAGHYTHDDIHIDLGRLCLWAGVRFIEATATGLNLDAQAVALDGRPAVAFDVLSVDTGSTPDVDAVVGAAEYAVPVKPVYDFNRYWQDFLASVQTRHDAQGSQPVRVGVAGSGVGGLELIFAMHHALTAHHIPVSLHWLLRRDTPIASHPQKARDRVLAECDRLGIELHRQFDVAEITASSAISTAGDTLALDAVFLCTAAAAPEWPALSGLATDKKGFIVTNDYLQSVSHPMVFASGDVGTQRDTPSPKAGVYAVRQAPVLYENLRRYVQQRSLKPYRPQSRILNLIALGRKTAIASRGSLALSGDWVWRWKHFIDSRFMQRFVDLPVRSMHAGAQHQHDPSVPMRCNGCGAKVSASVLTRVLAALPDSIRRDDVVVGLESPDDAAVINPGGQHVVQSVDQFRAMIDDPWILGRIAALHALSDLFAMGAQPQSAMALVALPEATDAVVERELKQLMTGLHHELSAHGCELIGGHTSEALETSVGLVVNGLADSSQNADDNTANSPWLARRVPEAGTCLILTKPIGTGVILAGAMQTKTTGEQHRACIESMLISNRAAMDILLRCGAQAMTDITGFGLIGHLSDFLRDTTVTTDTKRLGPPGIELDVHTVPLLPGALALSAAGIQSTLLPANRRYQSLVEHGRCGPDSQSEPANEHTTVPIEDARIKLLYDPQTSGGLLAAVPPEKAEECVAALHAAGAEHAAVIGRCLAGPARITLRP